MKRIVDFGVLIPAIAAMDLKRLKAELPRARTMVENMRHPAAFKYRDLVEARLRELQLEKDIRQTPLRTMTQEDVAHVWRGIEHAERVLTELNPIGKAGRRRPHLLSRTRQSILKKGIEDWFTGDYSSNERRGQMESAWHRNLWAGLSTLGPSITFEQLVINRAHQVEGAKVGTTWDIIEALWPLYGHPVPPRSAHSTPANHRAISRIRRDHAEELLGLNAMHACALPDTDAFERERVSIQEEREAAP